MDNNDPHIPDERLLQPLNWDVFFDLKLSVDIGDDKFNVYLKGNSGPLFYLIHGGGYSGLTWSCFAEILSSKTECQILAPDLCGHGETEVVDTEDYSVKRQVNDLCNIYWRIYGTRSQQPPLIIVGHSMGGSLAVHLVHENLLPNVMSFAVIDVVEGSAMAALNSMTSFLRSRPQSFGSMEKAISWCLKSGTTKNLRAARVSMPSQIVARTGADGQQQYHWRIKLFKTQAFWNEWFRGLSKKFLECSPSKILILANVDRLDKELLTGQMRGMFQTSVLPKVGHACHEDSPELVADIFVNLIKRYKAFFQKFS